VLVEQPSFLLPDATGVAGQKADRDLDAVYVLVPE
jgi:hypothetical protein